MAIRTYDLKARVRPGLIVLLPIPIAVAAWVSLDGWPWLLLGSGAGWLGLGYLLGQFARDAGRAREPGLFAMWGGKPSTVALRHAGTTPKAALAQYHAKLAPLTAAGRFPTPTEEAENPIAADETYDAAVGVLRTLTRSVQLVEVESVNYAYRRNLYALKPVGVALSATSGLAAVAAGLLREGSGTLPPWWGLAGSACLVAFWTIVVNPTWVRRAARSYVEALLAATHTLTAPVHAAAD